MKTLKPGTAAHTFCEIPLALALATVTIIEQGLPKVVFNFILAEQAASDVNMQNKRMNVNILICIFVSF